MTNHRLDPSEFLPFAPDTEGEQVNVNHADCPAGTDTKRRLYVKRIERGKVVAYCHHCGGRGLASPSRGDRNPLYSSDALLARLPGVLPEGGGAYGVAQRSIRRADKGSQVPKQKAGPSGRASFNRAEWPVEAIVWLNRFGIEDHWKWYYEPGLGRLCYTVRDIKGQPVLKCCRALNGEPKKYLNFKEDFKDQSPRGYLGFKTDVLVITEDILSAQKCVDAGYSAFPMLSTTVKDSDLLHLTEEFKHGIIIVWTDNDNTDVRLKRNKLKDSLSLLGVSNKTIKDYKDPKYYSVKEIKEIVNH